MGNNNDSNNENENPNKRIISEEEAMEALLNKNKPAENNNASEKNDSLDLGLGVVKSHDVALKESLQEMGRNSGTTNMNIKRNIEPELRFREFLPNAFPSNSLFYENGRKTEIRPASLEEMINYSQMNEEDIYDVQEKIGEIMDKSFRVTMGEAIRGIYQSGQEGSYKDIVQFDKVCGIFSVRDLSMASHQRESKLFQEIIDPKTGNKTKVEINKDIFDYHQIKSWMMELYSPEKKCFILKDESFSKDIEIYVPTIGVVDYVTDYTKRIREKIIGGKSVYIDKAFLEVFQFLVPDWRLLDKDDKYFLNQLNWWKHKANYDEKMTITKFVDKLDLGITNKLLVKFGEVEVRENIYFPSYKSLFNFSGAASKLIPDTE